MPFAQIKDLLKRTSAFHKRLEELYRKIEKETHKQAIQYLADYMKGREKILQKELARFSAEKLRTLLADVLDAEMQMKGESANPDAALTHLVTRLSAAAL